MSSDVLKKQENVDTSGAHVDGVDIGPLRAAFEDYVNPEGDVALHWQPAGYYAGHGVQQSWLDFQSGYWAGHAAAKSETVASDGHWYFVSNNGIATLCIDREDAVEGAAEADLAYPHMAPHRAVRLVPADHFPDAAKMVPAEVGEPL